jgi:glyoxylase-like metal-dependent hydrolase (beta-lactamase superfamily II)
MTKVELNLDRTSDNTIASIGGTGFANTGAIKLGSKLIVIDTSLYKISAEHCKEKIEHLFAQNVSHVIYTHYHGDHTFGSSPFRNAEIISSKNTSNNIQIGYHNDWKAGLEEEDPLVTEPIEILKPSVTFDSSHSLSDEELEIQIRKLGGHTSGSSIIYFPNEKMMFSGDLIFHKTFPYGGDPTCDVDLWIEALRTIKTYNVDKIIPGHGPVIRNKHDIDHYIKFFENVRETIKEGIENYKPLSQIDKLIEVPEILVDAAERRKEVSVERWYNFYNNKFIENS